MANKLFKLIFAVAMVLGSALGFVACEEQGDEVVDNPTVSLSTTTLNFTQEEGSQTVDVAANAEWKVENDTDWVTVTPEHGDKDGVITVAVSMNDTGAVRSATIKVIALHKDYGNWETKKLTVNQSGDSNVTVEEKLLYSDNFDGKEATKTYGSGSSWPYIDQFPEFANPEGEAAANVTYSGSGVSVRANSTSNSSYSDYAGSGSNNIFFGGGAYFQINDIAPLEGVNFKVTFGTEKYTQDGDSTFRPEEFLMYISKNGTAWAPVEYTYAGTEPGRWNVATANFTLNAEVEKLYIKFEAKVASVYRLDDLKLYVGNGGQTIDLDNIKEPEPTPPPTTDALYFENFDGKAAVKDGNYWPYVTDFPEMKNAAGVAAENVSYDGHNTTVRNNSNSDGTYSDYAGSGLNNIFFGKVENHFTIQNLALESSQKNLTLTFGTEKYSQDNGSKFTPSEFIVSLSADGEKWSSINYTFAGTAEGRWNVATANFTLKEVPAALYIKFSATVDSSYRLDDVTLNVGEGGQEIDLANGTENPGGGDEPDQPENPDQPNVPADGIYESDSAFVCAEDDSANSVYGHKDTTIGGEAVTGFKLGTGSKSGYFKSGAVGVDGDKYLNFYAVAWKGKSAILYMRVDGGQAISFELNAHVGATGNPPYTALTAEEADHYSILLEGLTATSRIEFSTDASFTATANDKSGRAIVFGMKLTDEPIGTETPGGGDEPVNPEPEPEPTPGDTMTIAEALAVGEGNTIGGTIEGVVISNMDLNNLTSKKGMYVQDATGALQFYLAANHSFAFGTKVRIDLTSATLGSYNGAVQVSGVAWDKITEVSTGNAVEAKVVSMADFLANKYEGQYIALEGVQVAESDLSKTWVMGGAHTSINMEDANGNTFVVFSSKYATYGSETVAQGAGTIKGISSINNGNIQIIFAQSSDFAGLTGERLGDNGGEEPEQPGGGEEPETPAGYAGRDDFNTLEANASYIERVSTAGWVGQNCAVQKGGPNNANPVIPELYGSDPNVRGWVMNGKTSAVGKITSPVLTTGCGTLTFTYALAFSDKNGFDFDVDIVQNGEVVKSFNVLNANAAKYEIYTFTEEVNVAGDFQIVFTNNCPSATDGNKDRYAIWDVMWTAQN
ncbi:MAG: BACON domain-containing protein [Alistipes sp.]|nr:BACON domain-containing protein [Alistipes sp.]